MRKNQLMLLALTMFQFSCEPNEDAGPDTGVNYDQISAEFHDMFSGAFSITESLQMASVVDRTEKRLMVKIEVENISSAVNDYFADRFRTEFATNRTFYPVPPGSNTLSKSEASHTLNQLINPSSPINIPQKVYIESLIADVAEAENYLDGFALVSSFRSQVVQSRELSKEDKLLLLEIAAGSEALLEFMENGGIDKVQSQLIGILGGDVPYGKIAGCSVNWRSIWVGAVVGLAAGAVSGTYVGATAGTVTVPILGTAAGAIGGAVFGGAAGFTSGVVYGIATDLIASCSRSGLQQTYSTCEAAWNAFMTNQTNTMPSGCFIVEVVI